MACPILTEPENFQIWKLWIGGKLKQEKVWDTITQSPPSPGTINTSTSTDSWSVYDKKAAGIIIAHVSDRLLIEVSGLPHAKDMFDELVKIHEKTNVRVSAFYTYMCMARFKWDGSAASLNNHITTISLVKKQVDREFLVFILLNSLPDESAWESFCTTVLNSLTPRKSLSFNEIANCLTFTVATQEGASSSDAALKADVTTKQKAKGKTNFGAISTKPPHTIHPTVEL
ncbi:hypothetical protein C0993_002154 [Termitomyces sp. T159_Od127]|nr:hypothetical protein C0993_002154 [Termitomyces sp. T159_Od127]